MGSVAEGEKFFKRFDSPASAIADPDLFLYRAFGLTRGTLGQLFGPRVWLAGLRAMRKGHGVGKPVGDPLQNPGMFLVDGGAVAWSHVYRHIGDHPDLNSVSLSGRA